MTTIEKLERALKLAKDLKFTDQQVEELVSLVLGLPITRVTWQQPTWTTPGTTTPLDLNPTIICTSPQMMPFNTATFGIIGTGPSPSGT